MVFEDHVVNDRKLSASRPDGRNRERRIQIELNSEVGENAWETELIERLVNHGAFDRDNTYAIYGQILRAAGTD
jgi:hypothetical protein